jgi:hypothetical protein
MADLNTAVLNETIARLRAQAEQTIRDSEMSGGFGLSGARAERDLEVLAVVEQVVNGTVPAAWASAYADEYARYYGHGRQSEPVDPNRGGRD